MQQQQVLPQRYAGISAGRKKSFSFPVSLRDQRKALLSGLGLLVGIACPADCGLTDRGVLSWRAD
jgi:hypothetical protein